MKAQISFVCQECGYDTPKFLGKCPECGMWNSLKEIRISGKSSLRDSKFKSISEKVNLKPRLLSEIKTTGTQRLLTGFSEVDTVLGGGIVKGSVTLLAGDPGIGKSTLLLQTALNISQKSDKVIYISGEESEDQIKIRAQRILGSAKKNNLFLLSFTNIDAVVEILDKEKPSFVVVDSIQTMESENVSGLSGSVPQVRYSALQLIKLAKTTNIPIIIVGHVTKEGTIAGPMILSHMVDAVLFLEGEKTTGTRILRSLKNRFGPVDEVGIFALEDGGMKEIKNPEQIFLTDKNTNSPGSVLAVTLEGTRAFLVEIQSLVVFSKLPIPRRVASGIDYKRLELLLAVLQKHINMPLDSMDVFVNVAGGLKLSDPASDLAICLAVFSSFKNISLSRTVGIAEVGLLGELRTAQSLDKRIKQAKKLGFKSIITSLSANSLKSALKSLE